MAKISFHSGEDDVKWLKETHLKGAVLPLAYKDFRAFTLEGNEDTPHAVNLYTEEEPLTTHDYMRYRFGGAPIYAEGLLYSGKTRKPYGGFKPLD